MGVEDCHQPDWLNVSRETFDCLKTYVALVQKWNPAINLVSKSSLPLIWERHVLDSAQIFEWSPPGVRQWVDFGSGAGFPGLVIAVLAKERAPDLHVRLVEADQRKATFMVQAIRQLGVRADVSTQRIETLSPQGADVLSARALSTLAVLCGYAHLHLSKDGIALFPKGALAEAEIAEARKDWLFDLARHPSRTDSSASILAVRGLQHV